MLGLAVYARQVQLLIENSCDMGQGYLFSPPLEPKTFEELMKGWKGF